MKLSNIRTLIHGFSSIGLLVSFFLMQPIASATGLISPVNSNYTPISIKSHKVLVTVENGFAITKIDQVFHNPNTDDLEAIYQFPLPKDAVSAEFTMWINGKPITAEVLEKGQARQIYEDEKNAGNQTGIAEKNKQQTFDISVSPVLAQQDIRVRFVYIQSLTLDHGVGRYVYPLEDGGTDVQQTAFWTANSVVEEAFSFDIEVKSGYPIEAFRFPQHVTAVIDQLDSSHWKGTIANGVNSEETPPAATAVASLDKDIVVYWRLAQNLPGSVDLVTHKPDPNGRGTFMMTFTPGDGLAKIVEGVDWTFVLDISGSMQGKYATLTQGIKQALGKFSSNDRFRIVLFNNSARELTSGYVFATPENVSQYINAVESVQPGGGTNLYEGLLNGINSLDSDRSSGLILVTDGEANVGNTQFEHFNKLLAQSDVRLFSFVMGNSANNRLIDRMTQVSNGFSQSVSNSDDIVGQILLASSKITHEAYHNIALTIDGVNASEFSPDPISSLYRGQQLVIFGHYWNQGLSSVSLTGKVSGIERNYQSEFEFPAQSNLNPEIERLWAFSKIKQMTETLDTLGPDKDMEQAVVDLSIEHGIVTDYTSMLIVDENRYQELGIDRNNQLRLQTEQNAQANRQTQTASDNRADQNNPMFDSSRADVASSGGGSLNHWPLTGLALMLIALRFFRNPRCVTIEN